MYASAPKVRGRELTVVLPSQVRQSPTQPRTRDHVHPHISVCRSHRRILQRPSAQGEKARRSHGLYLLGKVESFLKISPNFKRTEHYKNYYSIKEIEIILYVQNNLL